MEFGNRLGERAEGKGNSYFSNPEAGRAAAPSACAENRGQGRTGVAGRGDGWKEKKQNLNSLTNLRYL